MRIGRRSRRLCPLVSASSSTTGRRSSTKLFSSFQPQPQQSSLAASSSIASSSTNDDDDELSLSSNDDTEDSSNQLLPQQGTHKGWQVVQEYPLLQEPFDLERLQSMFGTNTTNLERLNVTPLNITLPLALMLVDPDTYPSPSRARKACRKGNIWIQPCNNSQTKITGRVQDRVYPGDLIGQQVRMGDGTSLNVNYQKPPFDLPVVYEDDYFALVNKPAGIVVYANRGGGHGSRTIRAALPFSVQPPAEGTYHTLRRAQPVHRLDKPTSGLLLIAKTKPAMVHLSNQFQQRIIQKTYTAICNGIPPEPSETSISGQEAYQMGVDVDPTCQQEQWQLIDHALEEDKSAVTIWRALQYARSLKAQDHTLTLVELKPKTGRYHQLRRHMAWVCERPIVGDPTYGDHRAFRERGLFLCSNRVQLEHPYYNTKEGRVIFDKLPPQPELDGVQIWLDPDTDKVMVAAEIPLPAKFSSFLQHEDERYAKLHT